MLRRSRLARLTLLTQAALFWEQFWRVLASILTLAAFFLALSFAGLWLAAPPLLRIVGVLAFLVGLAILAWPMIRLRWPDAAKARARLDAAAGLDDRPATTLADALANGPSDQQTAALWRLHLARASKRAVRLFAIAPKPDLAQRDPFALRALALLGLVGALFVAGPDISDRLADAFDWGAGGAGEAPYRVDAWIDPPAYTGRPPIPLSFEGAKDDRPIAAPIGSVVVLRQSANAGVSVEAKGALQAQEPANEAVEGQTESIRRSNAGARTIEEARFVLRGDGRLNVSRRGRKLAQFSLAAIPDRAPTIRLTEAPKVSARGVLTLSYAIDDDYGASSARAEIVRPRWRDKPVSDHVLSPPPSGALDLPPGGVGEAKSTLEWADSAYAGAPAELVLIVRDEAGNEGRTAPAPIVAPARPLADPLARALAEQRRDLVMAPDDKAHVFVALEALTLAPETFMPKAGVFLGLRLAQTRLAHASDDSDLLGVADLLGEMAQRIEDGDLTDAERNVRAAQKALRDALNKGAPPEEIAALTAELRKAMDAFLAELGRRPAQAGAAGGKGGRVVTEKQIKAMFDKMAEMAAAGDKEGARRMLEDIQNILDNLQFADRQGADPANAQRQRALGEADRLMREQQNLRDETFRRARRPQEGPRDGVNDPGEPNEEAGRAPDDENGDVMGGPPNAGPRVGGNPGDSGDLADPALVERQQRLRERLQKMQDRLKSAGGATEKGFDEAQDAMGEAQEALKNNEGGAASAAQGRALEGLRAGARALAQKMPGGAGEQGEARGGKGAGDEMGVDPNGDSDSPGENGRGALRRGRGVEASAALRARKVLEELRRRLSDPSRPNDELDYLERLLRSY